MNLNGIRSLTISSTVFTVCTTCFNITDPYIFSPQRVFMCFIRFPEETLIISQNRINRLVFIMEAQYVYCEIETEFSNIYYLDLFQYSKSNCLCRVLYSHIIHIRFIVSEM
jgi:hypothetical protein